MMKAATKIRKHSVMKKKIIDQIQEYLPWRILAIVCTEEGGGGGGFLGGVSTFFLQHISLFF